MPLDFAILGENGEPKVSASLDIGTHFSIIEIARDLNLQHWSRIADYYKDVDFSNDQIDGLLSEFRIVLNEIRTKDSNKDQLQEILDLLEHAIFLRSGVSVIAD